MIPIANAPITASNTAVFFNICVYLAWSVAGAQGSAGNALIVWC
jgi:hypothetical protein